MRIFISLIISSLVLSVAASINVYTFDDPALEKRFEHLTYELRCPKCQNQNLSDSDAPIAKDLKDVVYEMLHQGKSDDEIKQYLKQRYGEFILYKPEFSSSNFFLWFMPLIFFLGFLMVFLFWYLSRKKQENSDEL